MIALIDGDIVAYRCASSCKEEDPLDVAIFRVDKLMREILEASDSNEYHAFLTGSDNFRKKINPEYKANRKDTVPPIYLQDCREYLVSEWNAKLSHGCEADDLLGIHQNKNTVICSIDKDLLQIPGRHFNWTKQQYGDYTLITPEEGWLFFWKQMLIGDRTDNLFGIQGIGPKKADKLLTLDMTQQELFEVVYELYDDPKRFAMNATCFWIQQEEGKTWHHHLNLTLNDQCKQEQDQISASMISLMEDTSMEPITTT